MAQIQPQKLNIFQRGILQKCATFFVYMVSAATGAWIIDWVDKGSFIRLAEEAQRQNLLSPEAARGFIILIEARDFTVIFPIMFVGLVCGIAGWLFMRWAARQNWSLPTTLLKAVEFRSAMEQLGIANPYERIDFARKHKLNIFIALSPLIGKEQESVRAKLYPFAHHFGLGNFDVFARHTGNQMLCLDAAEYELIVEKVKKEEMLRESVAITAKNDEIKNLIATAASLAQENKEITKERDELRGKVRIQSAQEEGRVKRLRIERLLWTAYNSVIDRLMRDTPPAKGYTTPDIEAAFAAEWEPRADLREHMRQLIGTEEANPSEDFIKAVKAEFKEVGKLNTGSRPRKNP
jgi:hypothetical protein